MSLFHTSQRFLGMLLTTSDFLLRQIHWATDSAKKDSPKDAKTANKDSKPTKPIENKDSKPSKPTEKETKKEKSNTSIDSNKKEKEGDGELKKEEPKAGVKKEKSDVKKPEATKKDSQKPEIKKEKQLAATKVTMKPPPATEKERTRETLKSAARLRSDNTNGNNSVTQEPLETQVKISIADGYEVRDEYPTMHFAPPMLSEADKKALKLNLNPPKPKINQRTNSPYLTSKPTAIKLRMSHNHEKSAKLPRSRSKLGEDNRGS